MFNSVPFINVSDISKNRDIVGTVNKYDKIKDSNKWLLSIDKIVDLLESYDNINILMFDSWVKYCVI